jgi:hypothetical protein
MGAIVTNYKLFRNGGAGDTQMIQISGYSYDLNGYVATISVATE